MFSTNKNGIKLSIIIPVYNVENYLDECITSLISCSLDDCEIIFVNDGSTDKSTSILNNRKKELTSKTNGRTKIIIKENGGLSSARNVGLLSAVGEYVCFVDSDDTINYEKFNEAKSYLYSNEDYIVFNHSVIDEAGNKIQETCFADEKYKLDTQIQKEEFFLNKFVFYQIGWEAWGRFYKREIITKYNLRFYPTQEVFAEDILFNLQYINFIGTITISNLNICNYILHSGSLMGKATNQYKLNHFINLWNIYDKFIHEYGFIGNQDLISSFSVLLLRIEINNYLKRGGTIRKLRKNYKKNNNPKNDNVLKSILSPKKEYNPLNRVLICETENILKYLKDGNYLKLNYRNRKLYREYKKYSVNMNN